MTKVTSPITRHVSYSHLEALVLFQSSESDSITFKDVPHSKCLLTLTYLTNVFRENWNVDQ